MKKNIGIMCFSPTNTTRKVCNAIASGMKSDTPLVLDMTRPDTRAEIISDAKAATKNADHLIIGAPVYSGKLPLQVIECLGALKGDGKECSAVVVYGNRDYGIALHHMVEILLQNGFKVIAACAFIAQHSYSDIAPVAMGRPDISDIEKAHNYGAKILGSSRHLGLKDIPAQVDMISKSKIYSSLKPSDNENKCVRCGRCAKACPSGILSQETGRYISNAAKKQCIGCMACVKSCRQEAKVLKANPIVKTVLKYILRHALTQRNEPFIIV
jgi:Pyruvate/2-oxoacid:ferredoxin oxidoreductase delta subunit